jgi:hypothetical protein
LRNGAAAAADTRDCPKANSVNGASVPPMARPSVTGRPADASATCGTPSVRSASGAAKAVAAMNCTAVTATGSRPGSSRVCATVNDADSSSDRRISPSPASVALPWAPAPATSPTPASDTAYPAQAAGRATVRNQTAAISATITGVAPTSSAAWLTLVCSTPAFETKIVPP